MDWFCSHVLFVSWWSRWKGVYLHFLPRYCYRIYWSRNRIRVDRHPKPRLFRVPPEGA